MLPPPQVYLSYNNVSALKMLVAKANWALAREKEKVPHTLSLLPRPLSVGSPRRGRVPGVAVLPEVRMYTLEEDKFLSFRIEMSVCITASRAFSLLSNLRRRHEWDSHYV